MFVTDQLHATRRTDGRRLASLAAFVVVLLFAGLVTAVATSPDAAASPCPDGSKVVKGNCSVVVPPVPGPPMCLEGELRGDLCVVDLGPAELVCAEGEPIDELGGICATLEPASQSPDTCPQGSRGTPEAGCYILVARGPAGPPVCEVGTLVGDQCEIEGDPPTATAVCPVGPTVFLEGDVCFSLVEPLPDGECPVEADLGLVDGQCRRSVALIQILTCADGFGLIGDRCVRYEPAVVQPPECPEGSFEDADGECRKPVATVPGAYFCEDPVAALNGTSCVFTFPFVFECPADSALVDGRCLRVAPPVFEVECPEGTTEVAEGCLLEVRVRDIVRGQRAR